jgi:hypothetical protein
MHIQRGELVGDNVHRLLESGGQAARLRFIDLARHSHFDSPTPTGISGDGLFLGSF